MEVNRTYFEIASMADVQIIRRKITTTARQLGFKETSVAEIAIVITELATNLVVHNCERGQIWFSQVNSHNDIGLEIVACDQGPGINSIKRALLDRYSTAGTMGSGLGAIKRLMDEFDIHSIPNSSAKEITLIQQSTQHLIGGTILTTRKWLSGKAPAAFWQYGAVSRPLPGLTANGDAFYIADQLENPLIVVIDGLGHGLEAKKASQVAIGVIEAHSQDPLNELFKHLHQALLHTRGVALAAVKLNTAAGTFTHGGIGNVEVKTFPTLTSTPLPQPGILGKGLLPQLRFKDYPWPKTSMLVFYSDGISRKWTFQDEPSLAEHHPTTICHYLLREFGRSNDDATVVIVKGQDYEQSSRKKPSS